VTAVATPTRTPLRERLILLLGAVAYGLHPACMLTLRLRGITSGGDAGTQDMTIPGVGNDRSSRG